MASTFSEGADNTEQIPEQFDSLDAVLSESYSELHGTSGLRMCEFRELVPFRVGLGSHCAVFLGGPRDLVRV